MRDELEIIAHRGASSGAPENSRSAVELAWQQGADAVEIDFRLTRDGRIVASHDDSLERTAGVDWHIADHSLAELRHLDIGSWKGAAFSSERIATLDELLAIAAPPHARFYIELKSGPQITDELARVVQASGWPQERIVLICFSPRTLDAARRRLPSSPTYLVVEFLHDPHSGVWYPDADEAIATAQCERLTGVDLMAARVLSDPGLAARVRDCGLDLCVWTVDEETVARRLIALGVRRITTNRPAYLRHRLSEPR
jgi:glycerophosphoryl diester phosphodiesterase